MSTPENSHRTPDELATENELICEKLLGWYKWFPRGQQWAGRWADKHHQFMAYSTPSFDNWADAGLIMDALDAKNLGVEVGNYANLDEHWYCDIESLGPPVNKASTAPLAVRAAALAYIRSLP